MFTDAVVINKVRFELATPEKKKLIQEFVQFFTSEFVFQCVLTINSK